jgi:hypothetical protein
MPELALGRAFDEPAQPRRAAILCLEAAGTTRDAVERNALRRRAAELILPGVRARGPRRLID